jgi:tRNA U38,U39,U40 pseudouridine synthase TruA
MKSIKIKKLSDFAKYFNPRTWRNWRSYTYYRIFSDYFIVIEHA